MTKRTSILSLVLMLAGCAPKELISIQTLPIDSPTTSPSAEPFLFTSDDGSVYLSWVEEVKTKNQFKLSKLEDNKWSTPILIDSGKTWFVNWADYPMIAVNSGKFIAHYLDKSGEGTYAYDVKVTTSSDDGKTWTPSLVLHDDGKQAEHGFVSLLPYGDNFFVAWLDGRNTVMEGMEHHEGHHGQMSLRGAVLNANGTKQQEWELDDRTCDCCQTSAAMTTNGPVVVYRDRSGDEVRDMSIVRLVNGGWTAPQAIFNDNWKINGCPVNGPRVASKGNTLAIAWYSAPDDNSQVKVIFSEDGGETFGEPIQVDEGESIGRVDVVILEDGSSFVTWMEGTIIKGTRIVNGEKGPTITIASSSEARSSGFPQLTASGNTLIFAWTDDKEKNVKTAFIKL